MDKVFIKDLLARGIIGIYDWERQQKQDILINVEIHTDLRRAGETDAIEDCIDYEALSQKILFHVESSQRFTVEALATDIAEICFAELGAQTVSVRVEKPGAVRFTQSVGVEINRSRDS